VDQRVRIRVPAALVWLAWSAAAWAQDGPATLRLARWLKGGAEIRTRGELELWVARDHGREADAGLVGI
jgi:hypothetical protein